MKLSVLITYHNEGAWLSECLQSLLPQLESTDEVLIYDDASQIPAQEFVLHDPRVRCLRGDKNIGPARARNQLLAASTGSYVHFHDADDLFAVGWNAAVRRGLGQRRDAVFTDVQSFDEAGATWPHVMGVGRLKESGNLLAFALRGGLLAPAGTYARAVINKVGGYRPDLWQSEDYDFHIRLALAAPSWVAIDEDFVLIRRHARQRSRATREVWTGAIDSLTSLLDKFPREARPDAAFAATRAGTALLRVGATADAERAFELAGRLGGARYDRGAMQTLARLIGPLWAERLAALYRALTPGAVRKSLQRSGR